MVGDRTCVEQFKKVNPALAARAGEPGKQIIADLRHVAVLALMAGTGVINRDGATDFQAGKSTVRPFPCEMALCLH